MRRLKTRGEERHGMRLRYLIEEEPLGTAGPLRLAADEGLLADSGPGMFGCSQRDNRDHRRSGRRARRRHGARTGLACLTAMQ